MRLVGANTRAKVAGVDPLPGKTNYFIGNDPTKWRTNIPTYARVRYRSVYPGVDLVYYGHQGQLEYDFVVAPGADPRQIALDVGAGLALPERATQAAPLRIDRDGDLVVGIEGGEVIFHKPVVYQPAESRQSSVVSSQLQGTTDQGQRTRHVLDGKFVFTGRNKVSFEVASYDRRRPLVIDPVIVYSTYLGGCDGDSGSGIAVDSAGSAYVSGMTESFDFPTKNPFQPHNNGYPYSSNAFVTKFDPTGQALVYSTYLGGSGTDGASGIAVDSSGHAYVTGSTESTDFPTKNPFLPHLRCSFDGCSNAFVTKFDPTGTALVYSTYLGGSGVPPYFSDRATGIAVDSSGHTYVTGQTSSTDFPTKNPFQPHLGTPYGNAFVAKFDPSGQALVYSTYLGGSGIYVDGDSGSGIAVDSAGHAYVTGTTSSTDFPTKDPFQPHLGGIPCRFNSCINAFVTKFDTAGQALIYSTYLGGSYLDAGYGIAVGASGNAYVTGYTASNNFPTQNPFQPHLRSFLGNAFVTKFDPSGQALIYSTYLGGSGSDGGSGIAVDSSGHASLTGTASSTNFPTKNPFQPQLRGRANAFVTRFGPTGEALIYSSYLGGSAVDGGSGIAVDRSGNAYVTGSTASNNFPIKNPFQAHRGPSCFDCVNAFVTKISPGTPPAPSSPLVIVGPK
jgi:hypothetical protein